MKIAKFLGHNKKAGRRFCERRCSKFWWRKRLVSSTPVPAKLKRTILLASCLLLAVPAWPQVRSGSIVVLGRSRQRVVIAADSRVNFGGGKYEDSSCKITALSDKIIFAATGMVGDSSYLLPESLRFDATEEARRIFLQYSQTPENFLDLGMVGTLASNWGAAMAEHFRAVAAASPSSLQEWLKRVELSHESPFLVGIFAGLESDGEISVYSVHVDYAQPGEGTASAEPYFLTSMPFSDEFPDDFPLLTPFGLPEIVHEISDGKSDRAKQEISARHSLEKTLSAEAFARNQVIRMVDLTIAYHPKQEFVGGKIDAIELPRAGKIRWLQRKANCPEN
jgi:Proteasome subunit